jgi:hypothetical protein
MDTGFRRYDKDGDATARFVMVSWASLNEGEGQWDRWRG